MKQIQYTIDENHFCNTPCPNLMVNPFHENSIVMVGSITCTFACPHCKGYNETTNKVLCGFTQRDVAGEVNKKFNETPLGRLHWQKRQNKDKYGWIYDPDVNR